MILFKFLTEMLGQIKAQIKNKNNHNIRSNKMNSEIAESNKISNIKILSLLKDHNQNHQFSIKIELHIN